MGLQPFVTIGTSGWHYPHWRGTFYPADLSDDAYLAYYQQRFSSTELNHSFYQLPEESTLRSWVEQVSDDFVFSVKASRYLTHMKKLNDPESPLQQFLGRMGCLGDQLGPILFQLPPRWRCNPDRLESFLSICPTGRRLVFEFRDTSWFDERVYAILRGYNAAFCVYELDGLLSPLVVTADFVYVRLHGPGRAYEGSYSDDVLKGWHDTIRQWRSDGHMVFCYFDNDQSGYAARNARVLQRMLKDDEDDAR